MFKFSCRKLFFTLFKIFIFRPKIQLWFSEKIIDFSWWKTREDVAVLDFLAVDNFDFTRKIVKKIWVKNSWKCWGFVKIEFMDKNLIFREVCFLKTVNLEYLNTWILMPKIHLELIWTRISIFGLKRHNCISVYVYT